MRQLFLGVGTALVTPFGRDDSIDFETFGQLIDRQMEAGISALIACGTTGEPSTLSDAEQDGVIGYTVGRADGRAVVVAGIGGNDTKRVCRRAAAARKLGANAVLAVTPYYNKTTQAGLIEHFTRVADAAQIPVILYNVPSRTGLNLLPETALRLAEHPLVAGLKEASADLRQITQGAQLLDGRLAIYCGNDENTFTALALGAKGVISVASNLLPGAVKAIADSFFAGDIAQSRQRQMRLNPLIDALFLEVSPAPVKQALWAVGLGSARVRPPLTRMEPANRERLHKALEDWFENVFPPEKAEIRGYETEE
jgi:4-hydroxy-tetrahydrodipicolinate synthase